MNQRPLTPIQGIPRLLPWPATMKFQSAFHLILSCLPSTSHLPPHHHTSTPHQLTPLTPHQPTPHSPHPFLFLPLYPHPQTSIQPLLLTLSHKTGSQWLPPLFPLPSRCRHLSQTTHGFCPPALCRLALYRCCLRKKEGQLMSAGTQLSQWPATTSPTASPPPAVHWERT